MTGTEIVRQEFWEVCSGSVWGQGTALPVPRQVGAADSHQLTCMLISKTAIESLYHRRSGVIIILLEYHIIGIWNCQLQRNGVSKAKHISCTARAPLEIA